MVDFFALSFENGLASACTRSSTKSQVDLNDSEREKRGNGSVDSTMDDDGGRKDRAKYSRGLIDLCLAMWRNQFCLLPPSWFPLILHDSLSLSGSRRRKR